MTALLDCSYRDIHVNFGMLLRVNEACAGCNVTHPALLHSTCCASDVALGYDVAE